MIYTWLHSPLNWHEALAKTRNRMVRDNEPKSMRRRGANTSKNMLSSASAIIHREVLPTESYGLFLSTACIFSRIKHFWNIKVISRQLGHVLLRDRSAYEHLVVHLVRPFQRHHWLVALFLDDRPRSPGAISCVIIKSQYMSSTYAQLLGLLGHCNALLAFLSLARRHGGTLSRELLSIYMFLVYDCVRKGWMTN